MKDLVEKEKEHHGEISAQKMYDMAMTEGQIIQIKNCVTFQRGKERELTKHEVKRLWYVCQTRKLDPDNRQIYFICDGDKISTITSIDGFRLIAQRSGKYEGQDGPYYCGTDGKWVDVWLQRFPPLACKVGVYRTGFKLPLYAVALASEYAKQFGPWKQYPTVMLAKVAESLALRKAFPEELSGVYSDGEDWVSGAKELKEEFKEESRPQITQEKDIITEALSSKKEQFSSGGLGASMPQLIAAFKKLDEIKQGFVVKKYGHILEDFKKRAKEAEKQGEILTGFDLDEFINVLNDINGRTKEEIEEWMRDAE